MALHVLSTLLRRVCLAFQKRFTIPISVATIYTLISLCQELPVTAIQLFMLDNLKLTSVQMMTFYSLTFLPWNLKTLVGILTDSLPILGYRRRSYAILGALGMSGMYVSLTMCDNFATFLGCGIGLSSCVVLVEISTDSRVVELVSRESSDNSPELLHAQLLSDGQEPKSTVAAKSQSACMLFRSFGSVLATGFAVLALRLQTPAEVLLMTAIFPILTAIAALWIPETRVELKCDWLGFDQIKARSKYLLKVAWQVFPALLFVFVYSCPPSTLDIYPTYIYQSLDLEPWFLQLNAFIGLLGSMGGTLIYFVFFVHYDLKRVFILAAFLASLAGASQMLVPLIAGDLGMIWFVPIDGAFVALFARIAVMPPLVLAAQSCPLGMEGTLFTLFGTVANLAGSLSSLLSLTLVDRLDISSHDWSSLWIMILICSVAGLLPLIMLPCLARHSQTTERLDESDTPALT